MENEREDRQGKKVHRLVDSICISNAEDIKEMSFLKTYAYNMLWQQDICKSFRKRLYAETIMALIVSMTGVAILIVDLVLEGMGVFSQNKMAVFCIAIVAILFEVLSGLLLWISKETIKQLKQCRDDLQRNEQFIFMLGVVDLVSSKKIQGASDNQDLYMRVVESELRTREQSARK